MNGTVEPAAPHWRVRSRDDPLVRNLGKPGVGLQHVDADLRIGDYLRPIGVGVHLVGEVMSDTDRMACAIEVIEGLSRFADGHELRPPAIQELHQLKS